MQEPIISVIVPCYNAERYISVALESLLSQTFDLWECIVVNDMSTDNSIHIINKFSRKDSRIKSISIPHSGSPDIARSFGVNEARTNLILGLDADDYLSNDSLEKMLRRMAGTNSDVVFQRMVFFDQDTKKIKYTIPVEEFDMSIELSGKEACALTIGGWQIGFNGGLWRKSTYLKVPPGNEMNSDELTFRERVLLARKVAFCDTNYYMRLHKESTTHSISLRRFDRLSTDVRLEEMVVQCYKEESGIPSKMRKDRFMNLLFHQIFFSINKKRFNLAQRNQIRSIINNFYHTQNFSKLLKEFPIHWNIAFLTSYKLFVISSIIYHKIKPEKYFDWNL